VSSDENYAKTTIHLVNRKRLCTAIEWFIEYNPLYSHHKLNEDLLEWMGGKKEADLSTVAGVIEKIDENE
jgi:hypothetical protein